MNVRQIVSLMKSATIASWLNMVIQLSGALLLIPLIGSRWSSLEFATFLLIASVNRFTLLFSDRLAITFSMLFSYIAAGSLNLLPREQAAITSLDGEDPRTATPEQKQELFERTYATLGSVLLLVCIVAVGITSGIAFAALSRLAFESGESSRGCELALGIALATLALRINFLRYEVVLRGLDLIALIGRWNALFNGIGLLLSVVVVYGGGGIVSWGAITFATAALTGLRNYLLLRNRSSVFAVTRARLFGWHRDLIAAVWQPTWRGLLGNISYIGGEELVCLLAPFLLPAADVTSFLLYNRFYSVLGLVSQIPMTCRTPYMAKLIAAGDSASLTRFVSFRILLCSGLVVIGANAVGILVPILISFMTKAVPMVPLMTWSLVVVLLILERLNSMLMIVLEAGNMIVYHWRRCLVSIVTISILPFAFEYCGVAGGFFAILLPRVLLFHNLILTKVSNFLGTERLSLVRAVYVPVFVSHLVAVLLLYAVNLSCDPLNTLFTRTLTRAVTTRFQSIEFSTNPQVRFFHFDPQVGKSSISQQMLPKHRLLKVI